MCGICGFVGFKDEKLLGKMTQILAHRGPDDSGFYSDDIVSLGHRRLAIIDLTPGGHQPFFSEDKEKILVANGEIYNFRELRERLIQSGHRFFGKSDNEVILHAYEEWGLGFVDHLIGIFALAFWDKTKETLILVRDHLGVKPLYYTQKENSLIFASEVKAILAWEKLKKEVDPVSIDYYLTLRYLPGEGTMFREIKRLLPGSILIFKKGKVGVRQYWQPGLEKQLISEKEARERLKNLLEESVSSQLTSDVALGTYLSGGIDSSIVTALAQKGMPKPIKTFTLGFGSPVDETAKAKSLSKLLKTDHHQFLVSRKDLTLLPKIVSFLDEPIGDPIILPIFLLAQKARKKVKVVLTGDGADEIFGGYIHHLALYYGERIKKILPSFFPYLISLLPSKFIDLFFPYPSSIGNKGKGRLITYLRAKTLGESFLSFASLFPEEEKRRLYSRKFLKKLKGRRAVEKEIKGRFKEKKGDVLSRVIFNDVSYWLPDYILYMADRLSMANSLEVRVPYLDKELVDFVLSLPSSLKIKFLTNKYILRKAVDFLPKSATSRKKQAFFIPIEYFSGREMDRLISKTLSQKVVERRGLFNFEYLEELKNEFEKSPLLVGKQLMALVILELWLQEYADFKI